MELNRLKDKYPQEAQTWPTGRKGWIVLSYGTIIQVTIDQLDHP